MYKDLLKVQYHGSVKWFQVCVIIPRGWHGHVSLSRSVRLVQPLVMFVCRTLYHGNVQKVPSRALCLRVLSEAAEQRHVQGAERQALLSRLLREALRLIVYWQLFKCPSLWGLRKSERLSTESYVKFRFVGNRWLYNAKLIEIGLL